MRPFCQMALVQDFSWVMVSTADLVYPALPLQAVTLCLF